MMVQAAGKPLEPIGLKVMRLIARPRGESEGTWPAAVPSYRARGDFVGNIFGR